MLHDFGGPVRRVRCIQNGTALFIEWPLNGLIQIVKTTGRLWDARKGPWRVSPADLKRIQGYEPYDTRPKTLRPDTGVNPPDKLR